MMVFLNGKFLSSEEAKISVFDHGFLYGDGVYETLRTYKGKIWQVEEHLKRLERSAKLTALRLPWSRIQMKEWLEELLRLNSFSESRLRITVTRGSNDFDFYSCVRPTLLMVAQELQMEPEKIYSQGVDVITVPWQRILPEVKSISLFPLILAKQLMKKQKAYEALFVSDRGLVTEGTITNFFMVKKGVLITPKHHVLLGTTRGALLKMAKKLQIKVREIEVKLTDLSRAEEIFITNAPRGIIPVRKLNQKWIGEGKPGPTTKVMMKALEKQVHQFITAKK